MKNNALDSIHCMVKLSLDIQDLIKNYPPEYKNPSKKLKYEEALERFRNQQGSVKVSRWKYGGSDVGHLKKAPLKIDFRDEYFCYDDGDSESEHIFYLNYADPLLFGFYDGDLFAQDELQTLEHPLLGSVMEYIDKNESDSLKSRTEEHGEPTPYIVEGVPYWLKVVTAPVLPDGKVYNFYGRNFSRASKEILDLAVTPLSTEKRNNIIAMAAPSTGSGEYKRKELEQLMKTVELNEGLVEIGYSAFQNCLGLAKIFIPASVATIKKDAFVDCALYLGFSVAEQNQNYSADDGILYSKDKKTLVRCPCGWGRGRKGIVIPQCVEVFDQDAFFACTGIESIKLPSGVKVVAESLFSDCENLKSVLLPEKVETICWGSFFFCKKLESITIPSSVKEIESLAFCHCEKLKEIRFAGTMEEWRKVMKSHDFSEGSPVSEVVCTDGNAELGG